MISHDSQLITLPGESIALPPRYYAPVGYYALMARYGKAEILVGSLYDKRRKEVHRCEITDSRGPLRLTVPVSKPHGIQYARWTDVGVSDHGQWWNIHRVSLESAFGRTPFFEFYIDRFLPFLSPSTPVDFPSIADLDLAIDRTVREILLIETVVTAATGIAADALSAPDDSSYVINGQPPYYQVRALKQGFLENQSVLDLIFNLGPESPLYLRKLIREGKV